MGKFGVDDLNATLKLKADTFDLVRAAIGRHTITKSEAVSIAGNAINNNQLTEHDTFVKFIEWIESCDKAPKYYKAGVRDRRSKIAARESRKERLLIRKRARKAAKKTSNKAKYKNAQKSTSEKATISANDTPILRAAGIASIGNPHPDYTDAKEFYATDCWKKVRYAVMVKSSGRCECCGATAKSGATMNVDHIVPRWKDPSKQFDISNLQVLCSVCNVGKGAWDSTDWRK